MVGGDRHHRIGAERGQDLAEERPVDRGDDVALVLGATVVRGDIGALDVDVERLIALEGSAASSAHAA